MSRRLGSSIVVIFSVVVLQQQLSSFSLLLVSSSPLKVASFVNEPRLLNFSNPKRNSSRGGDGTNENAMNINIASFSKSLSFVPFPRFASLPILATRKRHFHTSNSNRSMTHQPMTNTSTNTNLPDKRKPEVAIIGAGAAGLAAARAFAKQGIEPTILEKDGHVGGVWKYVANAKDRPMYRGLRTNLPREIMAFREKRWGSDGIGSSFVTHQQVYEYLNEYATDFDLHQYITFGCQLRHLQIQNDQTDNDDDDDNHNWSKIHLEWDVNNHNPTQNNNQQLSTTPSQHTSQTFDAVCICTGHYAAPSIPHLPGLQHFTGRVLHSIEYDDPSEFAGQVVLCIGGRASGSDLAREISNFASRVYVSDSTVDAVHHVDGGDAVEVDVKVVPRTVRVSDGSVIHFASTATSKEYSVKDVNVIIFCSGYDYQFPFLHEPTSNLQLSVQPGERRVSPLYEQLWHAHHPSLTFHGLQHSILPFPFFEIQAEAVVSQLLLCHEMTRTDADATTTTPTPIPNQVERMRAAQIDAERGGPKQPGRVQDTHYLGSHQWDAYRTYAKMAGLYSEELERYVSMNKQIYDHSNAERKDSFPGGPDVYRRNRYVRDEGEESFRVVRVDHDGGDLAGLVEEGEKEGEGEKGSVGVVVAGDGIVPTTSS